MKQLTKNDLRARRIYNPWDLAKGQNDPQVFIDYSPQMLGRAMRFACWQVLRIGYKTDRGSPAWYAKTFTCYHPREDKAPQLQAALAWATERYRIAEWERSPFGSYHPKGTLEATAKQSPEKEGQRLITPDSQKEVAS